jgi:hypothetical protein
MQFPTRGSDVILATPNIASTAPINRQRSISGAQYFGARGSTGEECGVDLYLDQQANGPNWDNRWSRQWGWPKFYL